MYPDSAIFAIIFMQKYPKYSALVVIGGDSCAKSREFESRYHILDGHFVIFICCKIFNVFEKTKIN